MINLSIDHHVPERHDVLRGAAGSYERLMATLAGLRALGLPNLTVGVPHGGVQRQRGRLPRHRPGPGRAGRRLLHRRAGRGAGRAADDGHRHHARRVGLRAGPPPPCWSTRRKPRGRWPRWPGPCGASTTGGWCASSTATSPPCRCATPGSSRSTSWPTARCGRAACWPARSATSATTTSTSRRCGSRPRPRSSARGCGSGAAPAPWPTPPTPTCWWSRGRRPGWRSAWSRSRTKVPVSS